MFKLLQNKTTYLLFGQRVINAVGGISFAAIVALKYDVRDATDIYFMYSCAILFIVFEAGFPTIIVQRLSSDWLRHTEHIAHYLSCILFLSIILFVTVGTIGYFSSDLYIDRLPWAVLAFVLPILMFRSSIQNFYEGKREIRKIARERLLQAFLGYFSLISSLLAGCGVWSVVIYYSVLASTPIFINIVFPDYSSLRSLNDFDVYSLKFSRKQFHRDLSWQTGLMVQTISQYFSNNFWIVVISMAGYYAVTPIIALANQVNFAVVGFSTMMFSARLPILSAAYVDTNRQAFNSLCNSMWKESIYLLLFFVSLGAIAYLSLPKLWPAYSNKIADVSYIWPYVAIFYLSFYVNVMIIVENSKGADRFMMLNLFRICLSVFYLGILYLIDLSYYVPIVYMSYWCLVAILFKFNARREQKL